MDSDNIVLYLERFVTGYQTNCSIPIQGTKLKPKMGWVLSRFSFLQEPNKVQYCSIS